MSKKFLSGINVTGTATLNTVADAGSNTDKFLVLDASSNVSYRTAAELYADLGIGSTAAAYTSTLKHEVKASQTISKGQAVYVSSADGINMIVSKASNVSEQLSSKTMGLLETSLVNNGKGNVITEGLLSGLNTNGATAGDPVWLGVDGALIFGLTNKPYAPAHLVFIGIVTRVNANNGEIFVKVQNGFELKEIHDVDLITTTPINGHILGYNGTLWVNKTIAGWLGYTPVTSARTLTINGTTYDLSADRSWTISANQNARTEYEFTTNGSTATYSATYSIGQVDVFYNGSKLSSAEFTATNGTSVTLAFTPPTGQMVEIVAWETGGGVANGRTLTINGVAFDLSANRSWTIDNASLGAQPQLNGTGFVKVSGTTVSYDNSTYLTSITSGNVTTALGFTPYNSTNPSGYITSSALSSYLPLTGGTLASAPASATDNVLTIRNSNAFDNGYAYSVLALDTTVAGTMADVRLGSSTPVGIRIYAATTPLTVTPTGAGFQMFTNTSASFPGHMYFDSGANNSAAINFRTATSGGSITTRLRIEASGTIKLSMLTSNGFVKTGSSNGSLSVDTTTYLPLAGGTLTGALSGTSATFSSTLSATGLTATSAYSYLYGLRISGNDTGNTIYQATGALGISTGSSAITFAPSLTTALTLSSTGAATFSSSVFVGSSITSAATLHINNAASADPTSLSSVPTTNVFGISTSPGAMLAAGIGTNGGSHVWLQGRNTGGAGVSYPISLQPLGGNVGIGTSSPNSVLEVYGQTRISASLGSVLLITPDATSTNGVTLDTSYYGTAGYGPMKINVGGSERMRITSGGAFKATTDSTYLNSGAGYHEFTQSNTDTNLVIFRNVSASPYGNDIRFTNAVPNNNTNYYLRLADSSARCVIYSNGGIYNYQANNVNLSDERTKKDIIALESYWNKFKDIEIVKFKYKDQTHDDFNIGVIAQQVEKVAPEFVDIEGWDSKTEIVEGEQPLKAIYTADLYHATIKVLQEAMAKIETLEAEMAILKAKIK